jgi:hypothetical protein
MWQRRCRVASGLASQKGLPHSEFLSEARQRGAHQKQDWLFFSGARGLRKYGIVRIGTDHAGKGNRRMEVAPPACPKQLANCRGIARTAKGKRKKTGEML